VIYDIRALGTLLCDVTPVVDDWLSGARPNHGLAVTNPTERVIGFYSSDVTPDPPELPRSVRPALIIETVPEPNVAWGALAIVAWLRRRRDRRCRGAS
jgi:hypothetical protein